MENNFYTNLTIEDEYDLLKDELDLHFFKWEKKVRLYGMDPHDLPSFFSSICDKQICKDDCSNIDNKSLI